MKKLAIALSMALVTSQANALSVLEQHASEIDTGYCSQFITEVANMVFKGTIDHNVNTMYHDNFKSLVSIFNAKFTDITHKHGVINIQGEGNKCNVSIVETTNTNLSCIKISRGLGEGKIVDFGPGVLVENETTKFFLHSTPDNGCSITKSRMFWVSK